MNSGDHFGLLLDFVKFFCAGGIDETFRFCSTCTHPLFCAISGAHFPLSPPPVGIDICEIRKVMFEWPKQF